MGPGRRPWKLLSWCFLRTVHSVVPQVQFSVASVPLCEEENDEQGHDSGPPELKVRWRVPSARTAFVSVPTQGRRPPWWVCRSVVFARRSHGLEPRRGRVGEGRVYGDPGWV